MMSDTTSVKPSRYGWRFDHSYARLPARVYAKVNPTPVRSPRMVLFNRSLATSLGLEAEALSEASRAGFFTGNAIPDGAEPLAQAYAGHQYGHFTLLGDGRAILVGEQITADGGRFDIQWKGSGPTPYSRRGDGRAALGPMLREYVISEAMHGLGIPTTRSLAVAATGETLLRDRPMPGAVLTRVAASHLRIGTFEWAAAMHDVEALAAFCRYTLERHYLELGTDPEPAVALLRAVVERQAALVARWQAVGFVHGVMNTDNMSLAGETIDYGPCAFMDVYHPATVFSSIDHHGRYAYGNQPAIAQWNLARFAEALLPVLHPGENQALEIANRAVEGFRSSFDRHWLKEMRAKLGLLSEEPEDRGLIEDLLEWMQENEADFTNTFRDLTPELAPVGDGKGADGIRVWHGRWLERLRRESRSREDILVAMRRKNPAVIPRNHRVEEALTAATDAGDLGPILRLLRVLGMPYDDTEATATYRSPPGSRCGRYVTFCGT